MSIPTLQNTPWAEEADEEEDLQPAGGVECVRQLLVNAPADRSWRCWGYLVLCHVPRDRLRQMHEIHIAHADVARKNWSGVGLGDTEASDGRS